VGELQEALAQAEAAEAARAAAAEREMGALRAHQAAVEQRVVRQQEERLQAAQRQHEGLLRGAAAEGKEAAARAEALAAELEEWRGGARVSELEAAAEADRGRAEAATQERDAAVQARDEAETARAIAEALAAQAEEARAAHNEAMEKRMIEARHPACHPTPPPANDFRKSPHTTAGGVPPCRDSTPLNRLTLESQHAEP